MGSDMIKAQGDIGMAEFIDAGRRQIVDTGQLLRRSLDTFSINHKVH
jgi:hypothetical protein